MSYRRFLPALLAAGLVLQGGLQASAITNITAWALPEVANARILNLEPASIQALPAADPITREEFCEISVKLYAGIMKTTVPSSTENHFADTTNTAVNAAHELGLVAGRGNGTFDPQGNITREELCQMLMNIVRVSETQDRLSVADIVLSDFFKDADTVSEWAQDAVHSITGSGIMNGVARILPLTATEDSEAEFELYIDPNGTTTREQALALAVRFSGVTNPTGAVDVVVEPLVPSVSDTSEAPTLETIPGDIDGAETDSQFAELLASLPQSTDEKMAYVFGDGGYYTSSSEAEANMTNIEIPVWRLAGDGSKYSDTTTIQVNKNLANIYLAVFTEIFNGDEKFPIQDVGSYSWRSRSTSEHRQGTAIDINYESNYEAHYDGSGNLVITCGNNWSPGEDPYSIAEGGDVYNAFTKYGFSWGGNWSSKVDYMHFSYFGR